MRAIKPFATSEFGRVTLYTLPFACLFLMIPLAQLGFLERLPGDIGDARLNAYFLEHVWQVLIGRAESFVHLPIFAPNLWVGSFSDNHWGTVAVYVVARAVGLDSVAAFQIWWLMAYPANFAAALFAFRLLKFSPLAATAGALFFAFALPVAAHSYSHAQLSYRFGAALAIGFYISFLISGRTRHFLWALFFTVWQVYATIYIGFFTLIALLFVTLAHFRFFLVGRARLRELALPILQGLTALTTAQRLQSAAIAAALVIIFVLAFLPYLIPSDVYGTSRNRSEIWTMLPRISSYFYTASSALWFPGGWLFDQIPMRHEHQMFIGAGALILMILGVIHARHVQPPVSRILWLALLGIVIVTLHSDGVSLWIVFSDLPLASAIRAMTRIDLVMLFFAAGLIAVAIDHAVKSGLVMRLCVGLLFFAAIVESSLLRTNTMTAASARETLAIDLAAIDGPIPRDALLFFSQRPDSASIPQHPWFAMEVRAMWAGLELGYPVLNGYSGNIPAGNRAEFGNECREAGHRLREAYESWPVLATIHGPLEQAVQRVYLVGFPEDCTLADVAAAAREETRRAPLPPAIAQDIDLRFVLQEGDNLLIEITNSGAIDLIARAVGPDVVNIAWRWPDLREGAGDGFHRGPPLDPVHAGAQQTIRLPIPMAARMEHGRVEISPVEEGQFWFHDLDMPLLSLPRP